MPTHSSPSESQQSESTALFDSPSSVLIWRRFTPSAAVGTASKSATRNMRNMFFMAVLFRRQIYKKFPVRDKPGEAAFQRRSGASASSENEYGASDSDTPRVMSGVSAMSYSILAPAISCPWVI